MGWEALALLYTIAVYVGGYIFGHWSEGRLHPPADHERVLEYSRSFLDLGTALYTIGLILVIAGGYAPRSLAGWVLVSSPLALYATTVALQKLTWVRQKWTAAAGAPTPTQPTPRRSFRQLLTPRSRGAYIGAILFAATVIVLGIASVPTTTLDPPPSLEPLEATAGASIESLWDEPLRSEFPKSFQCERAACMAVAVLPPSTPEGDVAASLSIELKVARAVNIDVLRDRRVVSHEALDDTSEGFQFLDREPRASQRWVIVFSSEQETAGRVWVDRVEWR